MIDRPTVTHPQQSTYSNQFIAATKSKQSTNQQQQTYSNQPIVIKPQQLTPSNQTIAINPQQRIN